MKQTKREENRFNRGLEEFRLVSVLRRHLRKHLKTFFNILTDKKMSSNKSNLTSEPSALLQASLCPRQCPHCTQVSSHSIQLHLPEDTAEKAEDKH